jgi:hypothetical protein
VAVETTHTNGDKANSEWMGSIKSPLFLQCTTKEPVPSPTTGPDWNVCFPKGIGLNISLPEPVASSPLWNSGNRPGLQLNTLDDTRSDASLGFGGLPPDSWVDIGPATPVGVLPDHPFDMHQDPMAPPILNTEIAKLGRDNPQGTHEKVRTAYLQRLADPELAYHPIVNPYITVDWIPLDLHVYNGESPSIPINPPLNASLPFKFQSRYKTGVYALADYVNPGQDPLLPDDDITSGFSYHSTVTAELMNSVAQNLPDARTTPPGPGTPAMGSYFMHQLGYRTSISTWSDLGNCGTTLVYLNAGISKSPL